VKREAIVRVWGHSPQRGTRAEPLVGVRGLCPLKLKGFDKTTSKFVHKFSTFTTYTVYCELADDTVIAYDVFSVILQNLRLFGVFFNKKTV